MTTTQAPEGVCKARCPACTKGYENHEYFCTEGEGCLRALSVPVKGEGLGSLRPSDCVPGEGQDAAVVALRKWVLDYEADVLDEDQALVDDGLREFPLGLVRAVLAAASKGGA